MCFTRACAPRAIVAAASHGGAGRLGAGRWLTVVQQRASTGSHLEASPRLARLRVLDHILLEESEPPPRLRRARPQGSPAPGGRRAQGPREGGRRGKEKGVSMPQPPVGSRQHGKHCRRARCTARQGTRGSTRGSALGTVHWSFWATYRTAHFGLVQRRRGGWHMGWGSSTAAGAVKPARLDCRFKLISD